PSRHSRPAHHGPVPTHYSTAPIPGPHLHAPPATSSSPRSPAASVGLVLKEVVTRFRGAQAASLLSSAACRRLPTPCKNHTQRTFNELFGRLPKRTGWQPCSPEAALPSAVVRHFVPWIDLACLLEMFLSQ